MNLTVKETAEWLLERDNYLIINHIRPDGDACGSAAALCQGLRECGKNAFIFRNPDCTDRYIPVVSPYLTPEGFVPEYIVTVDTATAGMMSKGAGTTVHLAIDHHPSNSGYADNLCLNGDRSSCGEIVFEILNELPCRISKDSAPFLYIAVSTDTGCFSFANATSNSLRMAADAVDAGADQRELNRKYFRTKSKGRVLIEGYVMSHIDFFFDDRVAVITIDQDMMQKFGVTDNDMDDIAAIPGSVEGVEVGITIRELKERGKCKASVRSGPMFDSNKLCARFGGGGHMMASGCSLPVGVDEMKRLFIGALGEIFGK